MVTTGLGGPTTFSTFSAEVVTLLLRKELLWGAIGVHVAGSLTMTVTDSYTLAAVWLDGARAHCQRVLPAASSHRSGGRGAGG